MHFPFLIIPRVLAIIEYLMTFFRKENSSVVWKQAMKMKRIRVMAGFYNSPIHLSMSNAF